MTSIHVAPLKKMFQVQKTKLSRLSEVDFNNLPFGRIFADHMFVMDYHNGQWQQGTILPFGNLELSPATSALHYGQAFFDKNKNCNFDSLEKTSHQFKLQFKHIATSTTTTVFPDSSGKYGIASNLDTGNYLVKVVPLKNYLILFKN